jgi:hypothetical protein
MRTKNIFMRAVVAAILISISASAVNAASINYGSFSGTPLPAGITFQNVTESSGTDPTPLYGALHTNVSGLDFDPAGFVASASGGAQDITDGQLNFSVKGVFNQNGGIGINTLSVSEGGDLSLAGTGSPLSQVFAGAIINVKVTEVDGAPITPVSFSMNASLNFNLITNPGIVQPWSLATSIPIASELNALNIPYTTGATAIEVVIDNQLIAQSELASVAFIAKKDFVVSTITDQYGDPIPEPAAMSLASAALCGVLVRRKRK